MINLSAAAQHATLIGRPLNRMITIHWKAAGVPLEKMVQATGKFVDLFTRALARHGASTAWIWVHENGPDKGWHCHILLHVPQALVPRMRKLQYGWLKSITGRAYKRKVVKSKPLAGRLGVEVSNPPLHNRNLEEALSYVLKGCSQPVAARLALKRQAAGGRIIGKRCGTSENIGREARGLFRYSPTRRSS